MKIKQRATASAPGKLMLSGSYAVVHGQPAVVTAVDQRIQVAVQKNGVDVFMLNAPDLGLRAYSKTIDDLGKKNLPKAVRFIEHLYKRFLQNHPQDHGIIVTTKSDFSSKFGFGSSSAVTVAFAKALLELYQVKLSNKELFDLCYQAVIDVQQVGSGFDIAAAIWGGTLFYVSPAEVVEPIKLDNLPIIVGYTGIKADTPTLIHMVNNQLSRKPTFVKGIFDKIGQVSINLKQELAKENWKQAGQLLSQHHRLVSQLGVSSEELDELISLARESGAFGGTLSGAGGGDCMIAFTDEAHQQQVKKSINSTGDVIPVKLNAPGVRIE